MLTWLTWVIAFRTSPKVVQVPGTFMLRSRTPPSSEITAIHHHRHFRSGSVVMNRIWRIIIWLVLCALHIFCLFHLGSFRCHNALVCPGATDGGDSLQFLSVAANVLNTVADSRQRVALQLGDLAWSWNTHCRPQKYQEEYRKILWHDGGITH